MFSSPRCCCSSGCASPCNPYSESASKESVDPARSPLLTLSAAFETTFASVTGSSSTEEEQSHTHKLRSTLKILSGEAIDFVFVWLSLSSTFTSALRCSRRCFVFLELLFLLRISYGPMVFWSGSGPMLFLRAGSCREASVSHSIQSI